MCDDDGARRPRGANKPQMAGLTTLRDMKGSPSPIAAHFAAQPAITGRSAAVMTAAEKPKVEPEMQITMEVIKRYTAECMSQGAKKQRIEPIISEPVDANATSEKHRAKSEKRKRTGARRRRRRRLPRRRTSKWP